jgi:single-strand DNA-binding protein
MAGELIIPVVGNISEYEMKFLTDGTPVGRFAVASTPRIFKDGEWRDGETSWVNVTVWRHLAEHCADTLTKGMRVIVLGKFAARTYEKDGEKRTVWELTAEAVGPELTFATAKVTKASKGGGGGGSAPREDPFESASTQRPAAGQQAASQPAQQARIDPAGQSAAPPSDDW